MASELLSGRVVLGTRSVLALLLGLVGFFMVVLAVFMPRTTAVLVVGLFAAYALLDGLLSIVAAARVVRRARPRFLMLLEGLVDVATSVTAFILVQGERPRGLLALIAAWAIVTGALQMGWTFSIDIQRGRSFLAVAAALSVAFGDVSTSVRAMAGRAAPRGHRDAQQADRGRAWHRGEDGQDSPRPCDAEDGGGLRRRAGPDGPKARASRLQALIRARAH